MHIPEIIPFKEENNGECFESATFIAKYICMCFILEGMQCVGVMCTKMLNPGTRADTNSLTMSAGFLLPLSKTCRFDEGLQKLDDSFCKTQM